MKKFFKNLMQYLLKLKTRTVYVRLVFDENLNESEVNTLLKLFQTASEEFRRQFGIKLIALDKTKWYCPISLRQAVKDLSAICGKIFDSLPIDQDKSGIIVVFIQDKIDGPHGIVGGLTYVRAYVRKDTVKFERCIFMPNSSMYASEFLLSIEGQLVSSFDVGVACLLHEIGHTFGADDKEDENSVMYQGLGKMSFEFDEKSKQVILKNKYLF